MSRRLIVGAVLLGILILWIGLANPFNLGLRQSPYFSLNKFRSIQPGSRIEDAISLLGEPITVNRSAGINCVNCRVYTFLGDPRPWLISYKEAWLLVDERGRIVSVTLNSEP